MKPGQVIPVTAKELGAFVAEQNQKAILSPNIRQMTDRDRLAVKLFSGTVSMYDEDDFCDEAVKWAIKSANKFFDALENNNVDE